RRHFAAHWAAPLEWRGPMSAYREVAFRRIALGGSPRDSTRLHSGVDRLDADGTRGLGQDSTNPETPHPLKKHLHWSVPPGALGNHEPLGGTRSDEHLHARDTAGSGAEHLLGAMGRGKSRCLQASNRRPLPTMSSLRASDSWPLTVRSG